MNYKISLIAVLFSIAVLSGLLIYLIYYSAREPIGEWRTKPDPVKEEFELPPNLPTAGQDKG